MLFNDINFKAFTMNFVEQSLVFSKDSFVKKALQYYRFFKYVSCTWKNIYMK